MQSLIPESLNKLSLATEFDKLFNGRSSKAARWEDFAGWTLPYVYAPHDANAGDSHDYDFQSVGAQSTNHLANKIVDVLFPHGRPFFRLDLSQEQKDELNELDVSPAQIDEILSLAEKESMKNMSKSNMRTALLEVIKSLIITGNSLLYIPTDDDAKAQVYNVNDYVVLRDPSGTPYKTITRDAHVVATLPDDIKAIVRKDTIGKDLNPDDKVTIYTGIEKLVDGRYVVWQEIDNITRVPRQIGIYTEHDVPWIPLTWNLSRGHNYGTGLVEEYAGAFATYSSLAESLVNLAAIVADIKILVDPMGSTDVPTLNDSVSGTYVYGNADDISYLQLEKAHDMKFLHEQMETYARRIGAGFLFNSAVTRNAERVTAEEIRMQAQELEGSLGGVYGRLSETLQLQLARREVKKLGASFEGVEPTIVTGMESLSRQTELDDIMLFFRDLAILADLPERVAELLNFPTIISKLGAARRVEYKELLLDEDTVKVNRQQRQQEQAAQAQASKAPPAQEQQPETF